MNFLFISSYSIVKNLYIIRENSINSSHFLLFKTRICLRLPHSHRSPAMTWDHVFYSFLSGLTDNGQTDNGLILLTFHILLFTFLPFTPYPLRFTLYNRLFLLLTSHFSLFTFYISLSCGFVIKLTPTVTTILTKRATKPAFIPRKGS